MDCAVFQDAAAELALGILTGPDRAAALKHAERCASCQAEVASLAAAADRLLDLVPERGAPDGFESRMAAAFRQSVPGQAARRHRGKAARCRLAGWRRRASIAAAAAAAGALGFGLYQIGAPPQQPAYSGAEMAALRTPTGARTGEVVVTGAPQPPAGDDDQPGCTTRLVPLLPAYLRPPRRSWSMVCSGVISP